MVLQIDLLSIASAAAGCMGAAGDSDAADGGPQLGGPFLEVCFVFRA